MSVPVCPRIPGESFEDYKVRICENKNAYGLTFEQIADILNAESGNTYTESYYRKWWKRFSQGRVYERKRMQEDVLAAQSRELEKQRLRIADERAALKRMLRDEARQDAWRDLIVDEIKKYPDIMAWDVQRCMVDTDGTLVIALTDLHIGMEFDNSVGKYNSKIAQDRLAQYANEAIVWADKLGAKKCVVALGGDLISGVIHNLRAEGRESLVEQLKLAAEYVSEFIASISMAFELIDVYGVCGNHSRITASNEDAMLGEMLDDLVPVYVKARLSGIENIVIHESKEDKALESFYVENQHTVLVHGHLDDASEANIGKLQCMTGGIIDIVITGHMHENMFKDVSGAHIIRGGCLSGSGDEYCLKKRLSGKPSQMMAYVDGNGNLKAMIPVYF